MTHGPELRPPLDSAFRLDLANRLWWFWNGGSAR